MKLFNTLSNIKEEFEPLDSNRVRMYVCGVTVYDDCHLGHARSAVVFDVLRRYLLNQGFQVAYVRNFTDVDDKIIYRAKQDAVPWGDIVETYIQAYYRDMNRLGVGIPEVEPRATEHMPEIVDMISCLVEKGFAYRINGDVYFEVAAYKPYGQLSGRKKEDLLAGARVEVDERKKDPMDFALWKASKPGEPGWDSPWGIGRPGWHIECSAMSIKHLGHTFDIHGGGKDLIFPHHENEIAQSSACTGKEFARYWIHNGFVTIDEEKMSKSLGNFFTIQEIFDKSNWKESVTAETLRYFLLSTHYRSDLNFSDKALSEAKSALDNLYDLFQRLEESSPNNQKEISEGLESRLLGCEKGFQQAMDDDLNTPKALAEFQRLRGDVNRMLTAGLSDEGKHKIIASFRECGDPLGLFQLPVKDWTFSPVGHQTSTSNTIPVGLEESGDIQQSDPTSEWVEQKIEERQKARERKDFATADQIRQELAAKGIIIEDRPDGTTRWKR